VASNGAQSLRHCKEPSISADGRYVAFASYASNLVSGDTNGKEDVFVYDRNTDTIERISVAGDGSPGNGSSRTPAISSDGRYVAFESWASNLVPSDTNELGDIFVYDRHTHEVERVSLAPDGSEFRADSGCPTISGDGRYVAFRKGNTICYVYDRDAQATVFSTAILGSTPGYRYRFGLSLSADGHYLAFTSRATDLVPGATNQEGDVFVAGLAGGEPWQAHTVVLGPGEVLEQIDFGNRMRYGPLDHLQFDAISSPQRPDVPFDVTLTALDAEGRTVNDFNGSLELSAWAEESVGPEIVISEVDTDSPDAVEFTNVSGRNVDISLWQVLVYDESAGARPVPLFTFPAGTVCAADEVFVIEESGDAPGQYPSFFAGANIAWARHGEIGVVLLDAAGEVVDFMAAAALDPAQITEPVKIVPDHWQGSQIVAQDNYGQTYQRGGDTDHNHAADWGLDESSLGRRNSGLVVPFAGSTTEVAVAPTTVQFVDGVFRGEVAVLEAATEVYLRANDGSGHWAESNTFDVVAVPALVDHFEFDAVSSPQYIGQPFEVTITATDAYSRPAGDFDGSVDLCGLAPARLQRLYYGSMDWEQPVPAHHEDNRVQMIYLADDEIGDRGPITALRMEVYRTPGQTLKNWTIRMKHTPLSQYDDAPSWEQEGWTTVYQNDETIATEGLVEFQFSTPFEYDGVSNLMIDLSYNNSDSAEDGKCLWGYAEGVRTIYGSSNSEHGDPLTWSGAEGPVPQRSDLLLNVVLVVSEQVPVSPAVSGEFDDGVWTGQVSVPDTYPEMFLRADDGQGHVGYSSLFTVGLPPGQISGSKFHDLDGDGLRDAQEPGLPDWRIYLDQNQNGQWDETERSVLTDEQGDYCFEDLPRDVYTVAEVMSEGWQQTFPTTHLGRLRLRPADQRDPASQRLQRRVARQ